MVASLLSPSSEKNRDIDPSCWFGSFSLPGYCSIFPQTVDFDDRKENGSLKKSIEE